MARTKKQSQKAAVMNHLVKNGKITSMEAFEQYGITRLSAIIFTLRHDDGWNIESIDKHITNRYGNQTNYAEYRLVG